MMLVAPARERGLKSCGQCLGCRLDKVAPARERGLKLTFLAKITTIRSRSREGAWIEISLLVSMIEDLAVAPARERGLKYLSLVVLFLTLRRSREGAWIEIS